MARSPKQGRISRPDVVRTYFVEPVISAYTTKYNRHWITTLNLVYNSEQDWVGCVLQGPV